MNSLQTYFQSYREWKKIVTSFLLDSGTALVLFLIFSIFGRLIKSKVDVIMQGKTVEEVQQLFLSGSLENAELLTGQVLSFAYLFIGGLIILSIISVLIYSFSRAYLWNYLSRQKFDFRRHWKWNGLTVIMLFFFILYSLIYLLVQFILKIVLATVNTTVASAITQLISFFLLLLLCFYGFNASYYFVKTNQVWKSLGEAFHSFKSSFFIFILFSLVTAVLVGLGSFYLRQATLRYYWAETVISIGLLLLFISWFRIYTLTAFHYGKKLEAVIEKSEL